MGKGTWEGEYRWGSRDSGEGQSCPECGTALVLLRDFDIHSTAAPGLAAELFELVHRGLHAYAHNRGHKHSTYESRKEDLPRRKLEEQPDFPSSLVCPGCLLIIRKV